MPEVEYGDCPQRCDKFDVADETTPARKRYDIYRFDLCKFCPRRAKKLEFERSTIRGWELWLTDTDLQKVKFSEMLIQFNSMLAVKDFPTDKMTAKMAILVNLFENEKARYEKITRDGK